MSARGQESGFFLGRDDSDQGSPEFALKLASASQKTTHQNKKARGTGPGLLMLMLAMNAAMKT
jgi:hypothetical protein